MTEYCKGCGVQLQNEDPDALGYVLKLMLPIASGVSASATTVM